MLTYSIEEKGTQSIYEYLYNCIKDDIVSGVLKPNDKLPSKRAFADNHGISVITVENAYGQLLAEGYIYSKAKSGFYVSTIDSQISLKQKKNDNPGPEKRTEKEHVLSLISNHTSLDSFPFSSWAKIMRGILTEENSKLLIAPPTGGVYELREAIARHLFDFRGIICEPDQIIIGAGAEYLYSLIVQLLGRDKIYGLENPSSKKIRSIFNVMGVKTTNLSMDDEGIELISTNLSKPDIIKISPSHHFPTGTVMSVSRRYGLLQWANERKGRYIIEDDYDSEFRLQGRPIPSLFSMDATDKVIYFNTFSKSLASTIRISYMVLPQPLLRLFNENLSFYSCTVSNFEQYTLAKFIEEQHFEKHINRMRKHYRQLRDELIEELKLSSLNGHFTISEENSGLHFLLKLDLGKNDDELKALAQKEGIEVAFLSEYFGSSEDKTLDRNSTASKIHYANTAIINYSGLREEDIGKVVKALSKAWCKYN